MMQTGHDQEVTSRKMVLECSAVPSLPDHLCPVAPSDHPQAQLQALGTGQR